MSFDAVNLDHCIMLDSKIFHLRQQSEKDFRSFAVGSGSLEASSIELNIEGPAKPHVLRLPALSPFVFQSLPNICFTSVAIFRDTAAAAPESFRCCPRPRTGVFSTKKAESLVGGEINRFVRAPPHPWACDSSGLQGRKVLRSAMSVVKFGYFRQLKIQKL